MNRIQSVRITIRKGFEAFEWKFEPFEKDLKHSNANSNISKGIRSIRIQIQTIRKGFEELRMQIRTIRKGFEELRMQIRAIRKGFEAIEWKFKRFEKDSNHSNENSNH